MKYSEKMSDSYRLFETLAGYFCMTSYSKNDFFLVLKMIDILSKGEGVSIEKLAEMTGISTATISRFIKKCGFKNYYEFRSKLYAIHEVAKYERQKKHAEKGKADDIDKIIRNLEQTKKNLNMESLDNILRILLESNQRCVIGSAEDMSCFAGFWKDLLAVGKASYFFYDFHAQIQFLETAKQGDCFLLLTVDNQYVDYYWEYLNKAKKRGAVLVLFTQNNEDEFSREFDLVCQYGEPGTSNYGCYSLRYLASLLSDKIIRN